MIKDDFLNNHYRIRDIIFHWLTEPAVKRLPSGMEM